MATAGESKMDPPAGKRKREALGEVTLVTNNKSITAGGKENDKMELKKEKFDGVILKSKTLTTRQPLRTVAGTRQSAKTTTGAVNSTVLKEVKEDVNVIKVPDDDAMVVDPAPPRLPSITVRRSLAKENDAPSRQSETHCRVSTRSIRASRQQVNEDAEADRVFKKRRTSSEVPEETPEADEEAQLRAEEEAAVKITAEIEAYADGAEADPEHSAWDDLDADDIDDPLMVSEYVVEIFQYLKQVEVSFLSH